MVRETSARVWRAAPVTPGTANILGTPGTAG